MLAFNALRQQHRRHAHPYYGIVVALDTDSSKCKVVTLGVLEASTDDLPWASVKNGSFTSAGAGMIFSPRIGSKVIVTFPYGDANHPVVSPGYNPKPSEFTSPGTQHGWQDDSGNYLKVDEAAQTFTLQLATGASITVDANNKMTISATDVCVVADNDVDIQAGGDVNISGNAVNTTASQVTTDADQINTNATGPHVLTGQPISLN